MKKGKTVLRFLSNFSPNVRSICETVDGLFSYAIFNYIYK